MLQAAMFDGLLFDGGTLGEDLPIAAEVGVGGRHITQTFVITLVIIVLDEGFDLDRGGLAKLDSVMSGFSA